MKKDNIESPTGAMAINEADTNADTCWLGTNFTVLHYTNRTADVYPYDATYVLVKRVPIVTGATTYHHPNGEASIIIINEALFYDNKLDHSLLNPNQVKFNGVGFWDNPYDYMYELGKEVYKKDVTISMPFSGTKLIFESKVSTENELNVLPHLILTSRQTWNPFEVMRIYFIENDFVFISASVPSRSQGSWARNILSYKCFGDDLLIILDHH